MNKSLSRPASLRGKPYLNLRVISGSVRKIKSKKAPANPQKLSADHDTAIQEELYSSNHMYVKEL